MKNVWIGFGVVLLCMVLYKATFGSEESFSQNTQTSTLTRNNYILTADSVVSETLDAEEDSSPAQLDVLEGNYNGKADSLVAYALQRYGTQYVYGGASEEGFDCSGFTTYVYSRFGIDIPHGSTLQSEVGQKVALSAAKKGDLLIFTGTNPNDRTPGHVGIVINNPPKGIQFVHSSSNGGVKVSEVKGTLYEKR
ncbi:C40 family peptidase, partial [Rufibacter roseus]